ncbi:MAG: hypothetical protein FD155_1986 [Bacteroidetes bacterium]|nr:MAG: hypothetical protein FD155_1986 [Bacteroidota bacterium]
MKKNITNKGKKTMNGNNHASCVETDEFAETNIAHVISKKITLIAAFSHLIAVWAFLYCLSAFSSVIFTG